MSEEESENTISYDNTIARQEIWNSCGLKIPDSKTEQYTNSFFVRTVADWNKLDDTVVTADSVTAFSSAMGRVLQGAAPPHIGSQSRNVF